MDAAIFDREPDLVVEMQSGLREFMEETRVAGTLEDAGAKSCVHLERGTDDDSAGLVWTHDDEEFLCVLRVLCGEDVLKQSVGRPRYRP